METGKVCLYKLLLRNLLQPPPPFFFFEGGTACTAMHCKSIMSSKIVLMWTKELFCKCFIAAWLLDAACIAGLYTTVLGTTWAGKQPLKDIVLFCSDSDLFYSPLNVFFFFFSSIIFFGVCFCCLFVFLTDAKDLLGE